jgi:SAM-dependent methyltransferase
MTRHLDIGCGRVPRNPYGYDEVFGVDLAPPQGDERFRQADDQFDSVSAYDFLEHVPRMLPKADGRSTRAPFIELMDEIHRVLKPNGLLYAQTPVYPHAAVFQDPTHVNFLTHDTHHYFTQPRLLARMYGFRGTFRERRVDLVKPMHDYEPTERDWVERIRQKMRLRRGACSHIIWEFEAVK